MFIRRKRKLNVSMFTAAVSALLLLATELYAGSGIARMVDTGILPN